MSFSMYAEPISQWFSRFFSFNTLIIAIVTVGLLFVLTVISYGIDRLLGRYEFNTTLIDEIIWFISLTFTMFFLQMAFNSLYIPGGDATSLNWQYSNAQFIVLFYCLYIIRRRAVLAFNIVLPFIIYGMDLMRDEMKPNLIAVIAILLVVATSIFIYRRSDRLIDNPIYYLTQMVFAGSWWTIFFGIKGLGWHEIILLTLEFMLLMTIIHLGNIEIRQVANRYFKLEKVNGYDFLTNVRNRRSFDEVAEEVFEVYTASPLPLTVVMFDIDHFKLFNDQYGHQVGDRVLKTVAQHFSKELIYRKANAQVFRVGGEEFAIIFRNRKAEEVAPIVTDIRNDLVRKNFDVDKGNQVNITISIGISSLRHDDDSFSDFYRRVDSYLYQSKNNQRDSITVEGDVSSFK